MRHAMRSVVSAFLIFTLFFSAASLLVGCNKRDTQAAATKWTCPMHPEVISTQEGDCPKCNMKLVPTKEEPKLQPQQPDGGSQAAAKWTCPMHPEVVSSQEGLCPKCNMKLVPAKEEPKPQPSQTPGSSKTP